MTQDNIQTNSSKNIPYKKIIKICLNVIFYILILFIFLASIANIRAGKQVDSYPNIFGRGYLSVVSTSMEGDYSNSFKKGDMVVVNSVSEKDRQKVANSLKVGDIITFYDKSITEDKKLNTHRVVYVGDTNNDGNINIIVTMGDKVAKDYSFNSYEAFETKYKDVFGGNAELALHIDYENLKKDNHVQELTINEIRATYNHVIGQGGSFAQTISKWGLLIVVLPLVLFLAFEIYQFVKNLRAYKQAKYEETHKDEIENKKKAERERMKEELRKELLEEIKNEKEFINDKSNDESK